MMKNIAGITRITKITKIAKITKIMMLAAVIVVALAFTAFAKNYQVVDVAWQTDPDEGRMIATWERASDATADKTGYKIRLYRSNTSNPVTGWVSTNNLRYEFTKEIAAKGTGDYFFAIYPSKGGSKMKVVSDVMEVDAAFLNSMRDYVKTLEKSDIATEYSSDGPGGSNQKPGWISMPDGSWAYRDNDGIVVTSEWRDINGKRYYFSADGRMVTGWQAIDGLWYYFDDQGALLKNTMTPDGYVVNAQGVWIKNGEPVKSDLPNKKTADTSTVTILSEVEMKLSEKSHPGDISTVKASSTTGAKMMELSYSAEPLSWVEGEPVTLYVRYEVYNGYSFSNSVVFTCKKAAVVGHNGDNIDQTVELLYVPKYTLVEPTGIYMDSDNRLHWDSVEKASSYEVRVYYDDIITKKKATGTSINLSEYADYDLVSVEIKAVGNGTYILDSSRVTIEDVFNMSESYSVKVEGKLKRIDGNCTYIDANGEKVKDKWVKVGGEWYHFDSRGNAERPGWFTDTTGYKYYFDDMNRMVTGPQIIDGTGYVFNDGSDTSKPEGALIQ